MRPERHLRPAGGSTVETLAFLPGFMCDARVFSDQILALNAEQAIHLAPLSLDTTIPAMAKKVLEGAPNHLALVGQGLGALVAMDVLRQAPERVSRIALMGCSPLLESPQDAALRDSPDEHRAAVLATWTASARLGQTVGPLGAAALVAASGTTWTLLSGTVVAALLGALFVLGPIRRAE